MTSKQTLGHLFDSYDESKIHSQPGLRWDLLPGGERAGRERLVMDFFGNVQNVEVDEQNTDLANFTSWQEDLQRLRQIVERSSGTHHSNASQNVRPLSQTIKPDINALPQHREAAAKVGVSTPWFQRLFGGGVLICCALLWRGALWLESS